MQLGNSARLDESVPRSLFPMFPNGGWAAYRSCQSACRMIHRPRPSYRCGAAGLWAAWSHRGRAGGQPEQAARNGWLAAALSCRPAGSWLWGSAHGFTSCGQCWPAGWCSGSSGSKGHTAQAGCHQWGAHQAAQLARLQHHTVQQELQWVACIGASTPGLLMLPGSKSQKTLGPALSDAVGTTSLERSTENDNTGEDLALSAASPPECANQVQV